MRGAAEGLRDVETGLKISTHAPHARRGDLCDGSNSDLKFLLTRLMRGAALEECLKMY